MKNDTQIIILAGGKGKRMESEEPKALVKFKGKPFIEHVLNTIAGLNLETKPVIVVGYKKESIMATLGDKYEYAEQEEQLGTGDAVKCAKSKIKKESGTILVISADQPSVSEATLQKIILTHREKNPTITIGTAIVPDFEEWRSGLRHFGRIIRGTSGQVLDITEFKDATEKEKLVKELNLALYAFDSKWLWENIGLLKNENMQGEYYLTDLIKIARDQNKKVEAVSVGNIIEAIHPNSKAELEVLEKLTKKYLNGRLRNGA
jgi:bifunctional UDP-N-acetylglucosamine pyrophosphorylase/glucosamine-1-phosphate N-acetyltransferase